RLKRDVFKRGNVGVIFSNRTHGQLSPGSNQVFGVDGTFGLFDNLMINTYWAKTQTEGLADDASYRGQVDYEGDRYGVQLERLVVGRNFNPEVGFVSRHDMRKDFALFRFSPRPRASKRVRKYFWTTALTYIEDAAKHVETRNWYSEFSTQFNNSD